MSKNVANSEDSDSTLTMVKNFVAKRNKMIKKGNAGAEKSYLTKKASYLKKSYYDDDEACQWDQEARAKEKERIATLIVVRSSS